MRPVTRGDNPNDGDFADYTDAQTPLVGRLGRYCSYCEREIKTGLAVEHLEPKKGDFGRPELQGTWSNFLLACVNCNSTKGDKQVLFDRLLFPDRDNTFFAFEYTQDGHVVPAASLADGLKANALDTLTLTGIDKQYTEAYDENGKLIALDRMSQRMEAWGQAQRGLTLFHQTPTEGMREMVIRLALSIGSFSIWMKVFEGEVEMRRLFIERFPGTARDCFDAETRPVSPRPPNGLAHGGKV